MGHKSARPARGKRRQGSSRLYDHPRYLRVTGAGGLWPALLGGRPIWRQTGFEIRCGVASLPSGSIPASAVHRGVADVGIGAALLPRSSLVRVQPPLLSCGSSAWTEQGAVNSLAHQGFTVVQIHPAGLRASGNRYRHTKRWRARRLLTSPGVGHGRRIACRRAVASSGRDLPAVVQRQGGGPSHHRHAHSSLLCRSAGRPVSCAGQVSMVRQLPCKQRMAGSIPVTGSPLGGGLPSQMAWRVCRYANTVG